MDNVTKQKPPERARLLSFETFLRRTSGSRQHPDRNESQSPFGHCEAVRPLNQRQITHRRAMLKYMLQGSP
jgi:hypothetical protein